MTENERIVALEKEVSNLKEELQRTRKANVWKKIKRKYEKDFDNFNWTDKWNITDYNGEAISFDNFRNVSYCIPQAIGTLVRITLKKKSLNSLDEQDFEKADRITKDIIEVMKREVVK